MNIPETGKESHEQKSKYMGAGLHIAKISSIEPGQSKDGVPYRDKRGYPCVLITFRNKKGETIRRFYYYSDKPAGHESRTNDKLKCTTEWILANLKNALGVGTKAASEEDIKNIPIWLPVIMTEFMTKDRVKLTKNGTPIRYPEVGVNYWPGTMKYEEVKAKIDGVDCQVKKDKQPTGYFLEVKENQDPNKFDCDQKDGGNVEKGSAGESAADMVDDTNVSDAETVKTEGPSEVW